MKNNFFNFFTNNYQTLFLVFVLFGYVFFNIFPIILDVNSQYFSIPYRLFVFVFSCVILFKNKVHLNNKFSIILSLFWLLYAVKFFVSFQVDYYEPNILKQFNEVLVRIFVVNLFPCLALLSINYSKIDLNIFVRFSFFLLLTILSLNFLFTTFYAGSFSKSSGIFAVYYISSGHFGASLVIISSYFLFLKSEYHILDKKILLLGLLMGLFAIFISAARSPVLAIMVVGLYLVILSKKAKFLYLFVFFVCLSFFLIYLSKNLFHIDNEFVQRNYVAIFEGNSSGREVFFIKALNVISNNILFGGRILFSDGMYPHNIFLEILMSGGLLLFAVFCYLFLPVYSQINYFLKFSASKKNVLLIFALWLQYFILVQTSYNIHCNAEFWYFSSVIIGLSLKVYNEKIKSNDGRWNPSRNNTAI